MAKVADNTLGRGPTPNSAVLARADAHPLDQNWCCPAIGPRVFWSD